jgi:hypothetical protein
MGFSLYLLSTVNLPHGAVVDGDGVHLIVTVRHISITGYAQAQSRNYRYAVQVPSIESAPDGTRKDAKGA